MVSPYIYEEDNWVDDMELGSVELFRMTGDGKYLTKAVEYGRREPVTPWMGADSARHYQWYPFMNMGHYQIAAHTTDARLKAEFCAIRVLALLALMSVDRRTHSCGAFLAFGVRTISPQPCSHSAFSTAHFLAMTLSRKWKAHSAIGSLVAILGAQV